MTEYLNPLPHLLLSYLKSDISAADALSELIDNSTGYLAGRATKVEIELKKDTVTIYDNGRGVQDINALFRLGETGNITGDPSDISQYGRGAKDAIGRFGSKYKVETIRDNYHRHGTDWVKCIKENHFPEVYHETKPGSRVPPKLRGGGTLITIENLHEGRRSPALKPLANTLAERYAPGLERGSYSITIARGHEVYDLRQMLENLSFADEGEEKFVGEVAGRTYTGYARVLCSYSQTKSGVHIAFGDRVIQRLTTLNGEALPPKFYAVVRLARGWHDCLSTNKNEVVDYRSELEAELWQKLKDWIEAVEQIMGEARIHDIESFLSSCTKQIFKDNEANTHRKGAEIVKLHPDHEGKANIHKPVVVNRHVAEDGGEGGAEKKEIKESGLGYRFIDLGCEVAVRVAPAQGKLVVELNKELWPIKNAVKSPFQIAAIWPLVSFGLASSLCRDLRLLDQMIPTWEKMFEVEADSVDAMQVLEQKLLVFFLNQQPKVKEADLRGVA